jgi:hypothetical protein
MIVYPFSFIKTAGGGYDPDAQAFITATGISGADADAINQLVIDLKDYSLWSLIDAFYPFIGGTSTTCKYNLKDPQDEDASYRMSFNGSWTFSSNGVVPSSKSISNYGDTYWSSYGSGGNRNNNHHYYRYITGIYNKSCDYAGVASPYLIMGYCAGLEWFDGSAALSNGGNPTNGYSQAITKSATSDIRFYRKLDGGGSWSQFGSTLSDSSTQSTNSMYIGTINGANFPEEMRYSSLSYGQALTATQIGDLDTIVTTYNTTLGRNF